MTYPVGIMLGHFEPLTLVQLQDINHASAQVGHLHIIITPRNQPHSYAPFVATLQDKARWMQVACAHFDFVTVHTAKSLALELEGFSYDEALSALDTKLMHQITTAVLAETLSDLADVAWITKVQANPVQVPPTSQIRLEGSQPVLCTYQDIINRFGQIAPSARSHYTQTVCIVGGESSGKTTLVHKLAGHYGAAVALEMGRLYTHSHLGGTEIGLQYSDYPIIVQHHHQAIADAKASGIAPIVIVDTDYATTQAFCEIYEGRTHPSVAMMADTHRLDHTIFLTNNVPWVADGMRSLGDDDSRARFANKLQEILARHAIAYHTIASSNYHERYLAAVAHIDSILSGAAEPRQQNYTIDTIR